MVILIVNADDLGLNSERDRGIFVAFEQGIVTSSTVIANGASFESASKKAIKTRLPVGIHLNLSEGRTLSGPIDGLTDKDQRLPGKEKLRSYLLGSSVDLVSIRKEFSAQIERILKSGLVPKHIDGHQHCHIYPKVTQLIIELSQHYNIEAIRSVIPAQQEIPETATDNNLDIDLFRDLGTEANKDFVASGLKTPQGLWGLSLLHSLNTISLCRLIENIPDGIWELMTHPGYPTNNDRPFESAQRLTELRALCSEDVKTIIQKREIVLATYEDLTCVS